ncbi:LysR family transcriptional regulator [Ruicaihuangia caeni]|uniref:LysR family transcriptional regulator n=1 Tax=Ruicaihuangia caeni TaxID=3042517 RepID=A0AAW6T9D2_9MICO|nr:LysR family transcriptional regulator [Klugiella sp. YN-L-19]MDI2098648.1 LysR family transcriptional regulator [Klugiella sp. YN-L-19]
MELRHLTAFVAVAEELHFGRAAARLQMAQPPLSQRIRQLERELRVELFERTTRAVRLTEAGEALLKPAIRVLDDVDVAIRAARSGGRGELGRVSLGFSGASSHLHLPRLAGAVREHHPGLRLVLSRQNYANDALSEVADGSLDLAFVRLPINRDGVAHRIIEQEELVVALPAHHRLTSLPRIDLSDLAEEPFVTFPGIVASSVRDALVHACVEAGFSPQIAQEAPDTYTILALVAAGVGVTLTPSSVQHARDDLIFRPLSGPPRVLHAALAWRSNNHSPALQKVLRIAEEVLPTPAAGD